MSVGAMSTSKDLERLQAILGNNKVVNEENEQLKQQIAELKEQLKVQAEDMKAFEPFRPLLGAIPLPWYKVQLRDSAIMKELLGRMKGIYPTRFAKGLENMDDLDAAETKFVRQCLDSVVLACIRYCVSQNSRWNDMVGHYLSGD